MARPVKQVPLADDLSQGGKGSLPVHARAVQRGGLLPILQYGMPRDGVDGNNHSVFNNFFFKRPQSHVNGRGPDLMTTLPTVAGLRKQIQWASRDYALRKVLDDFFLGASSTFGRPVERSRLQNPSNGIGGVVGWGSFPLRSAWVTRERLTQKHQWGDADDSYGVTALGWFFGNIGGVSDVHVLETRGKYV